MDAESQAAETAPGPPEGGANAPGGKGLLVVFWAWAVLLAVITVAQLFDLDAVLDALDVKRWFIR